MNERMKRKSFLFFLTVIVMTGMILRFHLWEAMAQSNLGPALSERPFITKDVFLKGKALYEKQCALCHGAAGRGDGKGAYLLYPKPRNFVGDNFRLISTTNMEATDEDLFKTITRGMPGSAMPSWDFLSEEERWSLVYYLRYLRNSGKSIEKGEMTLEAVEKGLSWETQHQLSSYEPDPESLLKMPEEPSVNSDGISRGRELFVKACASCHGLEGKGDGKMAMKDNLGYPVRPRDLTAGVFKGSASSEDLFYRVAGGLPGSPMPGYKDALTTEQIWDLIHYIQTLPGETAKEPVGLRRSRLVVHKTDRDLETDPLSKQWSGLEPAFIALTPLWWREDRVKGVEVRALYNAKQIAIHLSWTDSTQDQAMTAPQLFSDGVAIQLSNDPDPPFFVMGEKGKSVAIWHWKASWQEETQHWEDVETQYPHASVDHYASQLDYQHGNPFEVAQASTRSQDPLYLTGHGAGNSLSDPGRTSPVEEARAEGLGTLTTVRPEAGKVQGSGVYRDGKWQVVFIRDLEMEADGMNFAGGQPVSAAFAVWNGAQGDRNGQKMVSMWNEMIFES